MVTDSCSRCDEALDQLLGMSASMPELRGVTIATQEVLANECRYARYAARVPVLRIGDAELDWPFDIERLRQLLAGAASR